MKIIPLTLKSANEYVAAYHRHHKPVRGCKFYVSVMMVRRAAKSGQERENATTEYRRKRSSGMSIISITRTVLIMTMKLSDLEQCPFCGSDEYFTTEYVYGTLYYNERFDGEETHNGELYDGLNSKNYSGRAYCCNCKKYLGNKKTNTVSTQVEKALRKG